jgi:hypothetical protein
MTAEEAIEQLADKGPWILERGRLLRHKTITYSNNCHACPLKVLVPDAINNSVMSHFAYKLKMTMEEVLRLIDSADFNGGSKWYDPELRKLMIGTLKPEIA